MIAGADFQDSWRTSHAAANSFEVPLALVQEMVAGTNVVIQVGDSRRFTEGVFSADALSGHEPGFKKALQRIQNPDSCEKLC